MPTWTALTTLCGREPAARLGAAMERLRPEPVGIGITDVEDGSGTWEVGGYFTSPPDETALALLSRAFSAAPFAVSQLPDTDWVAHVRRELHPVRAGRFFVYGSHDADKMPTDAGTIGLMIDAAMAFGTGHHGTTLGCLRALDRLADEGAAVRTAADIAIGCGTAVLAMATARAFGAGVVASDIDPVAIEVATANLRANRLDGRVRAVVAPGFEHPLLRPDGGFDLIVANILKAPLIDLGAQMAGATRAGGHAILSGLLNEQADEVAVHYARVGFKLVERDEIVDWTTLTLRRLGHVSAD